MPASRCTAARVVATGVVAAGVVAAGLAGTGLSAAGLGAAGAAATDPEGATDVLAGKPTDLAVTVYRAPYRSSGSINLDALSGFALVSETRTVHLPAGVSRLRFEGVADGIEPASAIVTGLGEGIIEKNREGELLSPSALVAAAVGKPVMLLRTDKKTGKLSRMTGTILSDAGGGVVFETADGIEALRCSGLPETFSFAGAGSLSATPTLSVRVHSTAPATRTVTLSYLARGFDWAADYVAIVSPDGRTLDLGAWVTLANGNGVGFPEALARVVAGKVNREDGGVEPLDMGGPILAKCWPRGSTSDSPPQFMMPHAAAREMFLGGAMLKALASPAAALQDVAVTARRVEQEQLGDLKLYRVPDRTTVASRQSKQVRLLDRTNIPFSRVYEADLAADDGAATRPARLLLRTRNDTAHHLGLPLPSGRIAVSALRGGVPLLLNESDLRDTAVDEDLEIALGDSPDVQVSPAAERTALDAASTQALPWVPGVEPSRARLDTVRRIQIGNARAADIAFELRLRLPEGCRVVRADHPLEQKNGRPIFRLTIPANDSVTVRYQTQHTAG